MTDKKKLASMIDHTLLKADATESGIRELCNQALNSEFASVCVNPCHVKLAAQLLQDSPVKVCTVIGFPLGANTPETKAGETGQAVQNGALEVDMVINIGALKSGQIRQVEQDIRAVVTAAKPKALVKVILETALLTEEEIKTACRCAERAGADFVKTSTGFGPGGADTRSVSIMAAEVGGRLGVKAAGGIRDYVTAMDMIRAGATRLGTSSGKAIISGK